MTTSYAKNPLRGFWDAVAGGDKPSTEDLKEAGIPERFFASVRKQVRVIHELRDDGSFAGARNVAREAAEHLLVALGENWEAPVEKRELPTDPRGLAELVARREGNIR